MRGFGNRFDQANWDRSRTRGRIDRSDESHRVDDNSPHVVLGEAGRVLLVTLLFVLAVELALTAFHVPFPS